MIASDILISNNQSLMEAVQYADEVFGGQIWWRGQPCFDWIPGPRIFREDYGYQYEQGISARFKQKAPARHPAVPAPNADSEWLFLMQHYRLPTRLLDWTESPLVATFFSLQQVVDAKNRMDELDGSLYALSPYGLNRNQISRPTVFLPSDPVVQGMIEPAFYTEAPAARAQVIALYPSEIDIRMMMQLSVFTIHASGQDIQETPGSDKYLIKFRVPHSTKKQLKEQLADLGIRASSLFPDLENLAHELAGLRFVAPSEVEHVEPSETGGDVMTSTDPMKHTRDLPST